MKTIATSKDITTKTYETVVSEEVLWKRLNRTWDLLREKTGLDPDDLEKEWLLKRLTE